MLGTMSHWMGKNSLGIRNRLKVALVGWMLKGSSGTSRVRQRIRCLIFYSVVVNAAISGLEGLVLSAPEMQYLDTVVVKKLRNLLKGKAKHIKENREIRQWSNKKVYRHFKMATLSLEPTIRRLIFLQRMIKYP